MMITDRNGTIKKKEFNGKIKDVNGNEITTFIAIAPHTITGATVTGTRTVTTSSPHGLSAGDDVLTVGEDGIKRSNIVMYVGETAIEFEEAILRSNLIDIFVNYNLISFLDTPEGFYTFSDNEGLIISESFQNLFVPYTSLQTWHKNITRNVNINTLNDEAMQAVFAGFNDEFMFFRRVDTSRIRLLKVYKMLCLTIEEEEKRKYYCQEFKNLLKKITNLVKIDDNGDVVPDPTSEEDLSNSGGGGFDIKWGER